MPTLVRASLTSSSLKGLITASICFIFSPRLDLGSNCEDATQARCHGEKINTMRRKRKRFLARRNTSCAPKTAQRMCRILGGRVRKSALRAKQPECRVRESTITRILILLGFYSRRETFIGVLCNRAKAEGGKPLG